MSKYLNDRLNQGLCRLYAYVDNERDQLVVQVPGDGAYRISWSKFLTQPTSQQEVLRHDSEQVKHLLQFELQEIAEREEEVATKKRQLTIRESRVAEREENLAATIQRRVDERTKELEEGEMRLERWSKQLKERERELEKRERPVQEVMDHCERLQWSLAEQRSSYLALLKKDRPEYFREREERMAAYDDERWMDREEVEWLVENTKLKPKERLAVLSRFLEDKTFAEIGKELKLTHERVRQLVNRAVRRLRLTAERSPAPQLS